MSSTALDPAAKFVVFRNIWSGATFVTSGEGINRMRELASWVVARR